MANMQFDLQRFDIFDDQLTKLDKLWLMLGSWVWVEL